MNSDSPARSGDHQQPREQFSAELTRRYLELRRWAVEHWPNRDQPLQASDFIASERELQLLLGARLHTDSRPDAASGSATGQFEDVTPMPWP